MNKIGKFEKVSLERFISDSGCAPSAYDAITLPSRATKGSAGYDLVIPYDITLAPGKSVVIYTGLRVRIKEGWMLMICPRSGLGRKYRTQLDNTVGIIDSDYYYSDNEGHIMCPMTNDSNLDKTLVLHAGDRFAQAIFLPFGITEDDDVNAVRNGGFGSTK